ncbi:MAG: hypothetical protein ACRDY5_04280, partial [Acidimicrobiales bacterium]
AGTVRPMVLAVCAAGIAGMIAASVTGHEGAALTFGLVTAAAVACLIVATAVSRPVVDEARAARVETLVGKLVAAGADEPTVRALVAECSPRS